MRKKVAIQGIKGSFHHLVANQYFTQSFDLVECESFNILADHLDKHKCTDAIMAIENSIAGSIIPNYALIDANNLNIIGEYYLSISHCLMGLSEQSISDIKEVHSHPMALLQCKAFFKKHPHIKLIEASDTAEVAKQINNHQLEGYGAIASKMAAKMYDLTILASDIQTIKNNQTRFVVLNPKTASVNPFDTNKASLRFTTDHKRGSLATVLNVMSDCKLNLTKIQSLPVIETPWKYSFFVDVTFENPTDFKKAKNILSLMVSDFKILGEYKNAQL